MKTTFTIALSALLMLTSLLGCSPKPVETSDNASQDVAVTSEESVDETDCSSVEELEGPEDTKNPDDFHPRPYVIRDYEDPKAQAEYLISYSATVRSLYAWNEGRCYEAILVANNKDLADKYLEYLDDFYLNTPTNYYDTLDKDFVDYYNYTNAYIWWELEALHRCYEYQFQGGSLEDYDNAVAEAKALDFKAILSDLKRTIADRYGIVLEYNDYLSRELPEIYMNQEEE